MTSEGATVFIVDDDQSVRTALSRLMRSAGLHAETFASAKEFLEREHPDGPGCMVLDLSMPGSTGLELQQDMAAADIDLPIVFLTGHGNVPSSVKALKSGAVDFLEKPVDEDRLLSAIKDAVEQDIRTRRDRDKLSEIQGRVARLTRRELQVFRLVVQGKLNKQVAGELGMSEKTVKVHRARVMQKMEADSLAELVRLAQRAGELSSES
ncbi:MAG: response regulator transcription factor [Gemmatimonadetes bacterium]|nr:response regulator transcription factor [Gemmatimonadota bacterium]